MGTELDRQGERMIRRRELITLLGFTAAIMRWKVWQIGTISTDNRGAPHGSLQAARPDILRITALIQCASQLRALADDQRKAPSWSARSATILVPALTLLALHSLSPIAPKGADDGFRTSM
jgi:hypothetical protein